MVVRPARALGAPQTISLRPSTVSTWQTRSRSALGCCTASITLATVKAFSLAPVSMTSSTSRPAMVMASATASMPASVSRWSLSQERVNFIGSFQRFEWGEQRRGWRASAQPGRGVGRLGGGKAVVLEPADIARKHVAQVRHAVLQHPHAVDAEAEGEALPDIRVDAALAQHVGMHHPAAENLQPVVALADLHLAAGAVAAHVHLRRGLGEGEVVRSEARGHRVGLEKARDEGLQGPFQVAHVDSLVAHQTLDLM